jgi:hypothetical protein
MDTLKNGLLAYLINRVHPALGDIQDFFMAIAALPIPESS